MTGLDVVQAALCGLIFCMCFCRGVTMDGRVRFTAMAAYGGLSAAVVAVGGGPKFWAIHASWPHCGILAFVALVLWESRGSWRKGMPDYLLKKSARWPHVDRRSEAERRNGSDEAES